MRPNFVHQVDETFWIITGISIILLLIITVAMLYFVYKYNKKRNPIPSDIEGNTTLEIVWTIIPVILVMIMFFVSWSGFRNMRDVPKDAMIVNVTGQMWRWSFEYDNKKKADTLYLPVNKDIKFDIRSQDVNHSFFLPAFRVKEDAIPGRVNYYWIHTTDVEDTYATCAEYCGLNHSYMYAPVKIVDEETFLIWKNYFPPDTTKKDTAVVKKDSLNASDSLKTNVNTNTNANTDTTAKADSLKKNETVPDMKKPDSLKK
jgi:cytochrome c oxidase subunit II